MMSSQYPVSKVKTTPPHVLTIAGSDSGGGAGIQADLKTFLALRTYGMSVITSLTAQNTRGVTAIHVSPADFVMQQFDAVIEDIRVDAIKIGMLADTAVTSQVAECLKTWRVSNQDASVILDPVMVATSGSLLLEDDAISTMRDQLFPLATLVTPNISEAICLLEDTSHEVPDSNCPSILSLQKMAKCLSKLGATNVLVKGGHASMSDDSLIDQLYRLGVKLPSINDLDQVSKAYERESNASLLLQYERNLKGRVDNSHDSELTTAAHVLGASLYRTYNGVDICYVRGPDDLLFLQRPSSAYTTDVLYESQSERMTLFIKPTINTDATHGTGCTLSSAIAAFSAHGHPLRVAVAHALQYMQEVLASGLNQVGYGAGPLDHGSPIMTRGIPLRTLSNPAPLTTMLVSQSWSLWKSYTRHPFVQNLGDGTLLMSSMRWFMQQDYKYLTQYARALSKAVAHPSATWSEMKELSAMSQSVIDEMQLHIRVCERMGISRDVLEQTMESRATVAYTRFVLDTAEEGLLPLLVSLGSCAVGYAEVGLWLSQKCAGGTFPGELYNEWVKEYSGPAYQRAVHGFVNLMEEYAQRAMISVSQMSRLQTIWDAVTRFEIGMWDEALSVGYHAVPDEFHSSS